MPWLERQSAEVRAGREGEHDVLDRGLTGRKRQSEFLPAVPGSEIGRVGEDDDDSRRENAVTQTRREVFAGGDVFRVEEGGFAAEDVVERPCVCRARRPAIRQEYIGRHAYIMAPGQPRRTGSPSARGVGA